MDNRRAAHRCSPPSRRKRRISCRPARAVDTQEPEVAGHARFLENDLSYFFDSPTGVDAIRLLIRDF
jgi:hypothetical protein